MHFVCKVSSTAKRTTAAPPIAAATIGQTCWLCLLEHALVGATAGCLSADAIGIASGVEGLELPSLPAETSGRETLDPLTFCSTQEIAGVHWVSCSC